MSVYVHGDNILQKESHNAKYGDEISRRYLREIRGKYERWKAENLALIGPVRQNHEADESVINERTRLFNEYKDFLDQQRFAEHFDSRSNLHSSALEEFMYYLFHDLVHDYSKCALIGKSHVFKGVSHFPRTIANIF